MRGALGPSRRHTYRVTQSQQKSHGLGQYNRPPLWHTFDFTPAVHGDESLGPFWWPRRGRTGRVEEPQHGRSQLEADLPGAEVAVRPSVCVVPPGILGQGPGSPDAGIAGAELGIDHEPPVKHKASIADRLEGFEIHSPVGKVKKCLKQRCEHALVIIRQLLANFINHNLYASF